MPSLRLVVDRDVGPRHLADFLAELNAIYADLLNGDVLKIEVDTIEGSTLCQSCGIGKATKELHLCPYAEVADRPDCNCCDECTRQCANEV